MANSQVEQVKSFFHSYAKSFDGIYGSTSERGVMKRLIDYFFRQSMYERFRRTLEEVRPSTIKSILDVGCGPGRYCVEYLKMGKKVVGIDLAQGMLDIAETLCRTESPKGDFKFILGDYMTTHFPEKYDAAVLMGLFDYIADPVSMLKKLRNDTTTIIMGSFPKDGGFLAFQRKVRYKLNSCPLYLYSRSKLEKILKDSGCTNYQVHETGRMFFVLITL